MNERNWRCFFDSWVLSPKCQVLHHENDVISMCVWVSHFPGYLEPFLYRFGGPSSSVQTACPLFQRVPSLQTNQDGKHPSRPTGDDDASQHFLTEAGPNLPIPLVQILHAPIHNRKQKRPSSPNGRIFPVQRLTSAPPPPPPLSANAGSPSCPVLHQGQVANDTRLEMDYYSWAGERGWRR